MASKKNKTFTEKQLQRLPEQGYWIETFGSGQTFYCIMNGRVKYARGHEWATLLWSCCPTRKTISEKRYGAQYEHFASHQEMLAKYPDLPEYVRVKSPNDF